jgi:hypothetical protein
MKASRRADIMDSGCHGRENADAEGGFEIVIGGIVLPTWVSFPGVLAAALLAVWMVVAARRP